MFVVTATLALDNQTHDRIVQNASAKSRKEAEKLASLHICHELASRGYLVQQSDMPRASTKRQRHVSEADQASKRPTTLERAIIENSIRQTASSMIASDAKRMHTHGQKDDEDLACDSDGEDANPCLPVDPELMHVAVTVPVKREKNAAASLPECSPGPAKALDPNSTPIFENLNIGIVQEATASKDSLDERANSARCGAPSPSTITSEDWFLQNPKLYLLRYSQQHGVEMNWQRHERGKPNSKQFFVALTVPRVDSTEPFFESASDRTKRQADFLVASAMCKRLVDANLLHKPAAEEASKTSRRRGDQVSSQKRPVALGRQVAGTGPQVVRTSDAARMPVPHQKGLLECCQQHALPGPVAICLPDNVVENLRSLAAVPIPTLKKGRSPAVAPSVFSDNYHANPFLSHTEDTRCWPDFDANSLELASDSAAELAGRCLPIFSRHTEIVQAIREHQTVLIIAEPGAGKSTQIIQYIIDDWARAECSSSCSIVQCVHSDLVAHTTAQYVAQSRAEDVGACVGHHTQQSHAIPPAHADCGRAIFTTYDVLLRRLEYDPFLADVSHVILDDVDARTLSSELILTILRTLLFFRTSLRLIVLGSINDGDQDAMDRYFSGLHTISIASPGTLARAHFAEEALEITGWLPGRKPGETIATALDTLRSEPDIELSLVTALVAHIVTNTVDGGILIFLPSIETVMSLATTLQNTSPYSDLARFYITPMHGKLPAAELAKCFFKPEFGVRKIVVATPLAEISVSLEDIVYVIDGGRSQEQRFDHATGSASVVTVVSCQMQMQWRRGRACRARGGIYYSLLCRDSALRARARPAPPMQTLQLEQILLKVRLLKLGDVRIFLALTRDPPDLTATGVYVLEQLD
eukprot:SAG11_NODE_1060_length_6001_cov_2.264317_3_plen_871_part_00